VSRADLSEDAASRGSARDTPRDARGTARSHDTPAVGSRACTFSRDARRPRLDRPTPRAASRARPTASVSALASRAPSRRGGSSARR